MSDVVTLERKGAIAVVTVNNPPVNALGHGVRSGLVAALEQGLADAGAGVLLLVCEGRTFMAGADIREFGKPMLEPTLPEVIHRFENSTKPVVAAIHGTALGGGLETALGCHYRVAVASARVGLPEVKLGLLPGAGGTQRLPRLTGAAKALEMITRGDPIGAEEALALGIVDAVEPDGDIRQVGLAFARRVLAEGRPVRRVRDLTDKLEADRGSEVFQQFRDALKIRARGLFSPFKCVDAVEAAFTLPFDEGMKRERALFLDCMASPQRAGLVHAFFAERQVAKVKGLAKETPVREVRRVGVVGAGTMGGGIAMNFANAGLPVRERHMLEVENPRLRIMAAHRKNEKSSQSSDHPTTPPDATSVPG